MNDGVLGHRTIHGSFQENGVLSVPMNLGLQDDLGASIHLIIWD